MSEQPSDLRRVVSSTGVYAVASLAQRGLAFLLLPIYTRFIVPQEYGVLELLNAFSAVAFAILMMGMPSAIQKIYHRDAINNDQRSRVLATALGLNLPVLLVGGGLLILLSSPICAWLLGSAEHTDLFRLVVASGVTTTLGAVLMASLRAEERAVAFSVLSLVQFLAAITLNILLVVVYELGIRGILWGNLISTTLALPLALWVVSRGARFQPAWQLARPLLSFGLFLIPAMLAGWVMDLSDRYVLRLYGALDEVAVYGVGYKLGMVLQLAVVWPFQLAWPAISFSISERPGHQKTYARALTYLVLVQIGLGLALAIVARVLVAGGFVGEGYRLAYIVVPMVALAYAFNGVQYCVSPGVHLAGKTRLLPAIAAVAALFNLGLNFLLIPRWGMMGASWATAAAFFLLALGTTLVGQRYYPVQYEYGRLAQMSFTGVLIFLLAIQVEPAAEIFSIVWHLFMGLAAFPLTLLIFRFFNQEEWDKAIELARRYNPSS